GPGTPRVPVMGIVAEGAHGQLGHVELPERDGARANETAHCGAVALGGEVVGATRAARGGQAPDEAEILNPERHAVKRAAPAPAALLGLEAPCGGEGTVGIHRDERAEAAIVPRDAVEALTGGVDGRELARADGRGERGNGRRSAQRLTGGPERS